MVRAMLVDPGVGEKAAPIGTEAWAQHMRLHLTNLVDRMAERPKDFHDSLAFFKQHDAWSLLKDDAGKFFPDFRSFCEFRKPWGLGHPLEAIEPLLKAAVGEKAYKLNTLPPAAPGSRHDVTSGQNVPKLDAAQEREQKRLRAVKRAPAEVQAFYREDVVGQVEAAALGPAKQTPETAAQIRLATNEAVAIVEAAKPETPKAKREVKRRVNAKIREVMGTEPKPASFAALLDKVRAMSPETRADFAVEVIGMLDAVYAHRVAEAAEALKGG